MKLKKENTKRFKETILLLSFLILFFSFSNKSFGFSKKTEEQKSNTSSLVKEAKAIVSANINLNLTFNKQTKPSNDLQINFIDLNSKKENKKFIAQIKNTSNIKPPNLARLYYLYFSFNSDELPLLA